MDEIVSYLRAEPLIALSSTRDDVWFTAADRETLRYRVKNSAKSGRLPRGCVLIILKHDRIALNISAAYAEDEIPMVRFLEWLQTRCEIAITEDGYGPSPELDRVGVRAFLPEGMRDRLDTLYEEAVRREPTPTFEAELDDEDETDDAN